MQTDNNKISFFALSIWMIAALFFLYEFFLRTFVGSLGHQIIADLKLSTETFALLGSAYYLAYGIMQIPVGIITDKFGVKLTMAFALIACSVATWLFAQSQSFEVAFLCRALMGLGSSFAFVCLLVIVSNWLPKKYFGFFTGASQFIGTMGPLLSGGPLIALLASRHETWREGLTQVGFFGVVLFILTIAFVKDRPKTKEKPKQIIIEPQEPLSKRLKQLFKNKQAWIIAIFSSFNYTSMALLGAIWGTEYLQSRELSQAHAATIISISWLGYAIGCPLVGLVSDKMKRRRTLMHLCSFIGIFTSIALTYLNVGPSFSFYAILFFMIGIASSGQNIGFVIITEQVHNKTRATAMGLNNALMTLQTAGFPVLTGFLISQAIHSHSTALHTAKAVPSDFYLAFALFPICYGVAWILSFFFIDETYGRQQTEAIVLDPK